MANLLEKELHDLVQQDRTHGRSVFETGEPKNTDLQPLPRRIEGGFQGLTAELDRRNRDWTTMLRQLEQQRLALEAAEQERDRLYAKLTGALPGVQASFESMTAAVAASKAGDLSAELTTHFSENMRALDELEQVASALTNNFLWFRSSWEQYARSVIRAERMREG